MAKNEVFELVQERGWRRGMGNLLRGELSEWFSSRKWWGQTLVWVMLINLILLIVGLQGGGKRPEIALPNDPFSGISPMVILYSIFGGMAVAIGVAIVMQGAVVSEKASGTAAWILSKPVSRIAFILAKAIGNALGMLFAAVLVPGLLAYLEISLLSDTGWLPPLGFLGAVSMQAVQMLFWLAFTLMLGTFFDSWGPVIGIPLGIVLGQQYLINAAPVLGKVLPYGLSLPIGAQMPAAISLMQGQPPASWTNVVVALAASVAFVAIAVWRFRREEL